MACQFPLAYDITPSALYHHIGTGRSPDPERYIDLGLKKLMAIHPGVVGIRAYIGLWNRMQSMTSIRVGDAALARKCAFEAFLYNPFNYKNLYVVLLSLLPFSVGRCVNKSVRRILCK